jgi:hypothetical protein
MQRGFQRLLFTLALAIASCGSSIAQLREGTELVVIDVRPNDVLNIRQSPSEKSRIVGIIPPDSKGVIYLGEKQADWIFVRYEQTEGWANSRFLTAVRASAPVVYKRWEEIFTPQYTKPLPPGYFDFIALTPDVQRQHFSGDGAAFCKHWRNAISYGKRIALGLTPSAAVDDIIDVRDGERVCGFVKGLVVSPLRIAVRGDDANRKISIIEWVDQRGDIHYTGSPKSW